MRPGRGAEDAAAAGQAQRHGPGADTEGPASLGLLGAVSGAGRLGRLPETAAGRAPVHCRSVQLPSRDAKPFVSGCRPSSAGGSGGYDDADGFGGRPTAPAQPWVQGAGLSPEPSPSAR